MNSRRKFEKIRRVSESSSSLSSTTTPRCNKPVFVGILTVSDRCARGEKCDLSGPNLQKIIQEHDGFRSVVKVYKIVPDEADQIAETLKHWSDDLRLQLVITTGGTGIGPRDVTPEATASVIDKETPGFTIAIITASLRVTPDAMVTRLKCGIRGSTIIINVPGSKKASAECLNVVLPAIPHGLECMQNEIERGCSCAATEEYPDVGAPKRKIPNREPTSRTPDLPVGLPVTGDFSTCKDGKHSMVYKPPVVVNLSEDDRQLTDADLDIESILSADESTLTITAPFSENHEGILNRPAVDDRNVTKTPANDGSVTTDEALTVINDVVRSLESEEAPIIDAFGGILAEDIRLAPAITGQNASDINGIRGFNANLTSMSDQNSPATRRNSVLANSTNPVVVKQGTLLTAYQIGLLAGQGLTTCRTFRTPVVGVLSIGEKEKVIANHVTSQIYLQQNSIKMVDLGTTGHNLGLLPELFRSSMSKVDIVVVISDLDACREMAASLITKIFGGVVRFSSISMRPSIKSFFVTTDRNDKQNLFFIVPENPVGSTICSLALIPAYRKMAGYEEISHKRVVAKLPLDKDLQTEPEYLQCKVAGRGDDVATLEALISNDNEAGRQFQYGINALAVLPARKGFRGSIQKGDNIDVLLIDVNNRN